MTHEFDVEVLGVGLRVQVAGMSPADFRRLRDQWARLPGHPGRSATISAVLGDFTAGTDVWGPDFDTLCVALRQAVNLRAIESRQKDLLLLHAAGLADPATGDVIALIGPSGAGKTTAASTLGTILGYVSDETVAVDADGRVLPFPKPLAVKQGTGSIKRIVGPDALGLRDVRAPLRLARIALLDRREESVPPTITTLGLDEALAGIIEQTSYFASLPCALQRLDAVVRVSGGVHLIRYQHAADLIGPVSELLRRPAVQLAAPAISAVSLPADDVGAIQPGSYERSPVDDWIEVGGEILVLSERRVVRLSPLGSVIWNALQSPQPPDELVERAEAAFGPAPDGEAGSTVHAMLDELASAGLVRRRSDRAEDRTAMPVGADDVPPLR
ncbi:PqqD family peptide modification chaperone [Leifsonia shinshuensis]|uniref:PqqD family peptide modification chaperone n=1 Tax=Leifsonia shinshuensis TaxID=150026 RepID=UPI001F50C0D3|nr:PqqD family peptide modification chaperone [Leifsonia shinshuensis]MCI0157503.1 PqqD family peptide modification chaperone [Leifsonia shinshuensis]